jgi:hypothetical protein
VPTLRFHRICPRSPIERGHLRLRTRSRSHAPRGSAFLGRSASPRRRCPRSPFQTWPPWRGHLRIPSISLPLGEARRGLSLCRERPQWRCAQDAQDSLAKAGHLRRSPPRPTSAQSDSASKASYPLLLITATISHLLTIIQPQLARARLTTFAKRLARAWTLRFSSAPDSYLGSLRALPTVCCARSTIRTRLLITWLGTLLPILRRAAATTSRTRASVSVNNSLRLKTVAGRFGAAPQHFQVALASPASENAAFIQSPSSSAPAYLSRVS